MKKKLIGIFVAMFLVFTIVPNMGVKTAKAGPYPELNLNIRWGTGEDDAYTLYWDAIPGAESYQVYSTCKYTYSGTMTRTNSVDLSNIINMTGDYTFQVYAVKPNLEGFYGVDNDCPSKHFEFEPLGTPLNVTVDNGKITWDEVQCATKYGVDIIEYDAMHPYEQDCRNGFIFTETNSIALNTFKDLATTGKQYYISVRAFNEAHIENGHEYMGGIGKSKYFTYYPSYNVSTSVAGSNGTISESASVTHDGNYIVTLKPGVGYDIASLFVNGVDVTSEVRDYQYVLSNIRNDVTVVVSYKATGGWYKSDDGWMYIKNDEAMTGWANSYTMELDFAGAASLTLRREELKFTVGSDGIISSAYEVHGPDTPNNNSLLSYNYGHKKIGFSKLDTPWYYFNDKGIMATGWKQIDSKWYYFGSSGKLTIGWKQIGTKWYYFDDDGIMLTGWQKINGKWYDLDANGQMLTGWQKYKDKWYFLENDGDMATGWRRYLDDWYYFGSDGAMCTGWKHIGDNDYYFKSNGAMATGWNFIDLDWYYFNGGARVTGWCKLNGTWYYFNNKGRMQTGWVATGGKWYYCKDDGAMATAGWLRANNNWYYLDEDGAMVTGWQKINGVWHYFYWNGQMVTGEQIIDGKKYTFDKYGKLQ